MSSCVLKFACPRVNDDQKINGDDRKLSSGRPHDYMILKGLFHKYCIFSYFILLLFKRHNSGRPLMIQIEDRSAFES